MISEAQLRSKVLGREIDPEWIDWEEAAKLIGVSAATMRRWRCVGIGPCPHRLGKRTIRFSRPEVIHYIKRIAEGDQSSRFEQRWDPDSFMLLTDTMRKRVNKDLPPLPRLSQGKGRAYRSSAGTS